MELSVDQILDIILRLSQYLLVLLQHDTLKNNLTLNISEKWPVGVLALRNGNCVSANINKSINLCKQHAVPRSHPLQLVWHNTQPSHRTHRTGVVFSNVIYWEQCLRGEFFGIINRPVRETRCLTTSIAFCIKETSSVLNSSFCFFCVCVCVVVVVVHSQKRSIITSVT